MRVSEMQKLTRIPINIHSTVYLTWTSLQSSQLPTGCFRISAPLYSILPSLSTMHASKFSLIVVLSCIAMIGAIPVGDRAAAETIARRQDQGGLLGGVTGSGADQRCNRGLVGGILNVVISDSECP